MLTGKFSHQSTRRQNILKIHTWSDYLHQISGQTFQHVDLVHESFGPQFI